MKAGALRERITIQQPTESVGARGGITTVWSTYKVRNAKVTPLSGQERHTEDRERSVNQVRFDLRYLSGVTPKMRVSWKSRLFDIVSVISVEERKEELRLFTEELNPTS